MFARLLIFIVYLVKVTLILHFKVNFLDRSPCVNSNLIMFFRAVLTLSNFNVSETLPIYDNWQRLLCDE